MRETTSNRAKGPGPLLHLQIAPDTETLDIGHSTTLTVVLLTVSWLHLNGVVHLKAGVEEKGLTYNGSETGTDTRGEKGMDTDLFGLVIRRLPVRFLAVRKK